MSTTGGAFEPPPCLRSPPPRFGGANLIVDPIRAHKLKDLKAVIRKQFPDQCLDYKVKVSSAVEYNGVVRMEDLGAVESFLESRMLSAILEMSGPARGVHQCLTRPRYPAPTNEMSEVQQLTSFHESFMTSKHATFCGREAALASLMSKADHAFSSNTGAVHVMVEHAVLCCCPDAGQVAEPGAGKTALMCEFCCRLRKRSVRLVSPGRGLGRRISYCSSILLVRLRGPL